MYSGGPQQTRWLEAILWGEKALYSRPEDGPDKVIEKQGKNLEK